MSDRDGYQPGVPNWVTTIQPDPAAAEAFYSALFGWEIQPAGGFSLARLRGRLAAAIAPLPPGVDPVPAPAWVTSIEVASADETAERAASAGGEVLAAPFDGPTGRMAVIADPTGGTIAVWQPERIVGCEVVNEAGAWAMSRLDTPDTDAAAAFYGALFGWTTETFDTGDASVTMFRLPGFVGGEPQQPVSREVVAIMAPAPGADRGRWSVDFWVSDVDEVAATAKAQGGAAVVEPFDMPMGRSAVLADPAGVSFSVTKVAGK